MSDKELLEKFAASTPGMTTAPRAHVEGRKVVVVCAWEGQVVIERFDPAVARCLAAWHRLLASKMDEACERAEKVIEHDCDGSA